MPVNYILPGTDTPPTIDAKMTLEVHNGHLYVLANGIRILYISRNGELGALFLCENTQKYLERCGFKFYGGTLAMDENSKMHYQTFKL